MIPCISAHSHSLNSANKKNISPQLVAQEIAMVIEFARSQGQSLEDLIGEILAEDPILNKDQRRWLSNIIIQAWKNLPSSKQNNIKDNHLSFNYCDNSPSTTLATN